LAEQRMLLRLEVDALPFFEDFLQLTRERRGLVLADELLRLLGKVVSIHLFDRLGEEMALDGKFDEHATDRDEDGTEDQGAPRRSRRGLGRCRILSGLRTWFHLE